MHKLRLNNRVKAYRINSQTSPLQATMGEWDKEPDPTHNRIPFTMPCCNTQLFFSSKPLPGSWINCVRCGPMQLPGGLKLHVRKGQTECCGEQPLDDGRCSMCLKPNARLHFKFKYQREADNARKARRNGGKDRKTRTGTSTAQSRT